MFSQPTEASLRWSSSESAGSELGKGDTHRAGADAPNWEQAFPAQPLLLQAPTSDPSNRLLPGPVTPFPSTPAEVSLTDPLPHHALLGPWKDHPIYVLPLAGFFFTVLSTWLVFISSS